MCHFNIVHVYFSCLTILLSVLIIDATIDCLQSKNCVNSLVLNTLRNNIRLENEACNNFWLHACGNWTSADNSVDNFMSMGNEYANKLQNVLQQTELNSENKLWQKLRAYLTACNKQQQKQQEQHVYSLGAYLKELYGLQTKIPISHMLQLLDNNVNEKWVWSQEDWLQIIAELRRFGVNNIFLHESVGVASFNATLQVLDIGMPNIEQSFESKHEILAYLQPFAKHISAELAQQVFRFELNLKTLQNKQHNTVYFERLLNFSELRETISLIDWKLYFDTLLQQETPNSLLINLKDIQYISNLVDLLETTPTTTISSYILAKLGKFLYNVRPHMDRYACIRHMNVMWPLAMDYIYDRYIYSTRHEDEIVLQKILQNLKAQFSKNLNHLQFNEEQLNFMQIKLLDLQLRIGNLPLQLSESYVEHYYELTYVNASNFYQNHWEMLRFRTWQQHFSIIDGLQQQHVPLENYIVNDDIIQARDAPYYVHTRNLLIMPMVFLQMPFYHHTMHTLLQHSLLGWMLSHELQHAFDPDGILLNSQGIKSFVGESISSTLKYRSGVQCLNTQLPPPASLAERMADVAGLQLVFDAYFSQVSGSSVNLFEEFSAEQLFFINFAQIFCGSLPTAIQHDRDDVRVLVSVANMPEFAEAYQCLPGTSGNPIHKCNMWRGFTII